MECKGGGLLTRTTRMFGRELKGMENIENNASTPCEWNDNRAMLVSVISTFSSG